MSDKARRALRTFAQGFLGVLVIMAVPALQNLIQDAADGQVDIDLNFWRAVVVAAIAGGVIALISYGQNLFEDKTGKDILPK